jgi:Skp family chaperone for outer membrane proteins
MYAIRKLFLLGIIFNVSLIYAEKVDSVAPMENGGVKVDKYAKEKIQEEVGDIALGKASGISDIKAIIREEMQSSIAFVNPYEILEKSEEYSDELRRIEGGVEARKQELRALEETAMKKKTEYDTLRSSLTDNAQDRMREEMINLEAQYRIKLQGTQEWAQKEEEKTRMRILKKIQEETEVVAKEENRLMVFAGGILYGAKGVDLTEKVLNRMNKKYRAEKANKKSDARSSSMIREKSDRKSDMKDLGAKEKKAKDLKS